jgi:hypothetical protein
MTLAAPLSVTSQAEGQPMTSTRWRAAAILAPASITAVALATPVGQPQLADGRGDRRLPAGFHIRIRSARLTEGGSR